MGGISFRRFLVTIMMLLMLFLIADNAFCLPPLLTSLLSTPDHQQDIMFDKYTQCFWLWAPLCLIFRNYNVYAEPKHDSYDRCIHQTKMYCRAHS